MTPDSKDIYKAALVVIGNEILSGRTQDTNTAWIAEQLVPQGVVLTEVRIVQDIESDIVEAVNALRAKSDYVFTTGGIGPTHDDITAQSLAKAFGVDLALHEKAYQILAEYYEGEDNVTAARRKMAMLPKGAKLIPNPVSGAPGFCFENVYAMAGVPRVMRAMFDDVKAMISCGKPVLSRTVTCSLQESLVADALSRLQEKYPQVSIGSYPHYRGGVLGLSVVLRSTEVESLDLAMEEAVDIIKGHGGKTNAMSIMSDEDRESTATEE
ncbi:MAG: competence/damage-inducible protein A [Rhodospirillales bacterium]|nr:competence/damage-inducible protein A [Alphaproteobacteria bacterium]USO03637.1 MAG: competence/damage-inducible protein A [Rhodospirillales bacterium]